MARAGERWRLNSPKAVGTPDTSPAFSPLSRVPNATFGNRCPIPTEQLHGEISYASEPHALLGIAQVKSVPLNRRLWAGRTDVLGH